MGIFDSINLWFMSLEDIIKLAKNPNTPEDILIKLSEDKAWKVRAAVAENPSNPEDILIKLSKDKDK